MIFCPSHKIDFFTNTHAFFWIFLVINIETWTYSIVWYIHNITYTNAFENNSTNAKKNWFLGQSCQVLRYSINFQKSNHGYYTRNRNKLVLRPPRTNYGKKTILYDGAALYNKLPDNIVNAKNANIFKKLLKSYVQKHCNN